MTRNIRDEEEGFSGRTTIDRFSDDEPTAHSEDSDGVLPLGIAAEGEPGVALPIPVWLSESSKSFHWRWVPLPFRKAGRATVRWLEGPQPPQDLLFKPWSRRLQSFPITVLDQFFPKRKQKIGLLLVLYFSWFLSWSLVLRHSVSSGHIEGYGKPTPINCRANYWSSGNRCGLNGYDCRPFNASVFAFRCPAFCSSNILFEPHFVGNQTLNYQNLVIGGPMPGSDEEGVYRADSFVCQAAIHAGVISDRTGGCGVVELTGASHTYFASKAHGISSADFPSTFPKSFKFLRLQGSQSSCPKDQRWVLLTITAVAIGLLSLFTTSPAVFFFSTFVMLFLQVGLVSDPPDVTQMTEMLSVLASRLLPASFIAYVLYLFCARPLLKSFEDPPVYQISKTLIYLPPAFIGALNNYTFAMWIPIQRLTPHDIKSQPGAPIALAIMIIIILSIVFTQAWQIRQGGLFFRYLKIYATIGIGLLILLVLPGFRLRIHHYILAILLMPGTAFPTRSSVFFQGLLLGLFINGAARWGFAPIIETPSSLGEIPGPGGANGWWGATSPNITNSSVSISLPDVAQVESFTDRGNGNITFSLWEKPRMAELGVDGISVLVNDVERWRGYLDEDSKGKFVWHRRGHEGLDMSDGQYDPTPGSEPTLDVDRGDDNNLSHIRQQSLHQRSINDDEDHDDNAGAPEDLFFRFAFLRGSKAGLYGGVGVWNRDGSWIFPPPPRT
ncbi:hypothetical protein AJ80_08540 [Polytolypa hystricis UAMH7299]|uniref:LCCL domain-containing protein n=1 Tax=Polytolypa hystricis (strain UAMH7299) TaxID=1447883 RepID=A0A2B7X6F8_POLH7|nr:hypothetical protein AJ80_08540 [Polytolypa hystricis UAMH7299]